MAEGGSAAAAQPVPNSPQSSPSRLRRSFDGNLWRLLALNYRRRQRRRYRKQLEQENEENVVQAPKNALRLACWNLVNHINFPRVVLVTICMNCVFLATESPILRPPVALRGFFVGLDWTFTIFFTLESLVSILAFGPKHYFKSSWNLLDFTLVISSWLSVMGGLGETVSALRAFRAVRPLRTINRVPVLRLLVDAVVEALPRLGQAILLCMFIFYLFGPLGVAVWKGLFGQRCVAAPSLYTDVSAVDRIQMLDYEQSRLCAMGNGAGRACPTHFECQKTDRNPGEGVTSFDNFAAASLAIFQIISLEDWTDVMHWSQDVSGDISVIYYIFLVCFGNTSTQAAVALVSTSMANRRARTLTGRASARCRMR